MDIINFISKALSVMTVFSQAFLLVGLLALFGVLAGFGSHLQDFIKRRAAVLSLIVASTAILGSLFYSEIAGYNPCELCWYQRIAMYPLLILLSMSMLRRDKAALDYSLVLALLGLIISLYHNYLFFGKSSLGLCAADGNGVSCLVQYVTEFNYITIPVMSLTAFLLIIFFLIIGRRRDS